MHVGIESDSHERKDRGLKMDWIRLTLGPSAQVRLTGWAALVPAVTVAMILALHLLAGWPLRRALALSAPWSLAAVVGLVLDPWLTHRLLRGLPLALALFGGAGLAVGAWRRRRGALSAESLRILAALGLAAFLLRALAVNHPDFYYPDLRTHARLVEKVQDEGLGFFVSPSRAIWEHGVWRTEAYGKTYAFPYTPAFHLPFTLLPARLRHAAPVPEARRGRGLDRADRPHLGPGPAPRRVRAGGGAARRSSRPTRRA